MTPTASLRMHSLNICLANAFYVLRDPIFADGGECLFNFAFTSLAACSTPNTFFKEVFWMFIGECLFLRFGVPALLMVASTVSALQFLALPCDIF